MLDVKRAREAFRESLDREIQVLMRPSSVRAGSLRKEAWREHQRKKHPTYRQKRAGLMREIAEQAIRDVDKKA